MASRSRDLVSIGEFSRITRLSVKALRLYDEERLLVPARVDANGYRYYSHVQATDAERIRLLRALELPLPQIRALLSATPEKFQQGLRAHRATLRERIAGLEEAVASLDGLLEAPEPWTAYTVRFEEVPPRQILSVRDRVTQQELGSSAQSAFSELFQHLDRVGLAPDGPTFALYHDQAFNEDAVEVEWCVPVARPLSGVGRVNGRALEGGRFAATLHPGAFEAMGPAYVAVHKALVEAGHRPAVPIREVYLVGPQPGRAPADYRTALLWPLG